MCVCVCVCVAGDGHMVLRQAMFPVSVGEHVQTHGHAAGRCGSGVHSVPGALRGWAALTHTHTQVLVSLHFYWLMYQSFSGSDALWVMRALGFEKQATVGLTMDSLKPNDKNRSKGTRDITFFTPHILLSFQNLVPTLPRMHLSHWVTSL